MAALTNKALREAIAAAAERGRPLDLHDPTGLVARVAVAGTVTFVVRYHVGKQRRRLKLGRFGDLTLDQARKLARERLGEVAKGEDPQAGKARAREVDTSLRAAVDNYLTDAGADWKPSTRRVYVSSVTAFMAWAKSARVARTEQVDPRALSAYRAHAIRAGRKRKAKGGSRKDVVELDERRSASAINCELRAVKSCLTYLRRTGQLPAIKNQDDIADSLRLVQVDRDRPDPFRPEDLQALLRAALTHDETLAPLPESRPITPCIVVCLLGGLRLGEAIRLRWDDVSFTDGTLRVVAGKTGRERLVDLGVSPALASMLEAMRGQLGDSVLGGHTMRTAASARQRLINDYGAPAFQWSQRNSRPDERSSPTLRSTCGSYLANAPGIFGAASIYRTAAQLGHSVQVAERHYLGVLRAIDRDARTLDDAMGIAEVLAQVIAAPTR